MNSSNNNNKKKQFDQDENQGVGEKQQQDEKQVEETKKKIWNKKTLIVPYTYESGPLLNFKREFRQLWTKFYVYPGSVMKNVRLIMTAVSNPSLDNLLVRKKPRRMLLNKMET